MLEGHGLIEVVEERQRRGFVERVFQRLGSVVFAPDLVEPSRRASRDVMSLDAMVAASSDVIRAVGSLAAEAAAEKKSLATATMVTDVVFDTPGTLTRFLEGVAELAASFDTGSDGEGHKMRVTLLAHSAPRGNERERVDHD